MPKGKAGTRKIFPDLILFQQGYTSGNRMSTNPYTLMGCTRMRELEDYIVRLCPVISAWSHLPRDALEDWKKVNITPLFQGRRTIRELQASQPHFDPWEGDEKLILETISGMWRRKITRSSQHRFTKVKSCLTSLISFYNEMCSLTDEERTADIVLLDFRKAWSPLQNSQR